MEFQEVISKEELIPKVNRGANVAKTGSQLTLTQTFQAKRMYDTDSQWYKSITKKLAIFLGSTNVAIQLVDNTEFRSLLESLDPRYPVPGRSVMGKELDKLIVELKVNMQQYISTANKILCADIWSKKGLSSSYMGITAHFFSRKDHCCHKAMLAVRRFSHPHTGE